MKKVIIKIKVKDCDLTLNEKLEPGVVCQTTFRCESNISNIALLKRIIAAENELTDEFIESHVKVIDE